MKNSLPSGQSADTHDLDQRIKANELEQEIHNEHKRFLSKENKAVYTEIDRKQQGKQDWQNIQASPERFATYKHNQKLRKDRTTQKRWKAGVGPNEHRKTEYGGYAHHERTKKRIGDANRGNVPHNKGKTRTDAAKEAIRAGVNRRNELIFLKGLKVLSVTVTEYEKLPKQIKHLRSKAKRNPDNLEYENELKAKVALRDEVKRVGKIAYDEE